MGDEADEPDDRRPDEQTHRAGHGEDERSRASAAGIARPARPVEHHLPDEQPPVQPLRRPARIDTDEQRSVQHRQRQTQHLCETVSNQRRLLRGLSSQRSRAKQLKRAGDRARLPHELLPRGRATPCRTRARPARTRTRYPCRTIRSGISTSSRIVSSGIGSKSVAPDGVDRAGGADRRIDARFRRADEFLVAPVERRAASRGGRCRSACRVTSSPLTAPTVGSAKLATSARSVCRLEALPRVGKHHDVAAKRRHERIEDRRLCRAVFANARTDHAAIPVEPSRARTVSSVDPSEATTIVEPVARIVERQQVLDPRGRCGRLRCARRRRSTRSARTAQSAADMLPTATRAPQAPRSADSPT